ncbi:MAG: hypothetical protein PHE12_03750, partial [Clostridia bacterium]|nr:hypothetical protein [Clostridia bacterium]
TAISSSSLITADKKVYYINYGGSEDIPKLKEHLRLSNINEIECAFFADCNNAARVMPHLKKYGIQKFIMPYNNKYQNTFKDLEQKNKIIYLLSNEVYTYKSIKFSAYYVNDNYFGASVVIDGKSILYLGGNSEECLTYMSLNAGNMPHIIFSEDFNQIKNYFLPKIIVSSKYFADNNYNCFSSAYRGNLIFEIKNDRIIKKYSYR